MTLPQGIATELAAAIVEEANWRSVGEASPLERMVYRARTDVEYGTAFHETLPEVVSTLMTSNEDASAITKLLIDLPSPADQLVSLCADLLTSDMIVRAENRLAALNILSFFERPVPAMYLADDDEIRKLAPLNWMDLMLPTLLLASERQKIILTLVRAGILTLETMLPRLADLWSAGGKEPGPWLERLADAVPTEQRKDFVRLTSDVFALPAAAREERTRPKMRVLKQYRRNRDSTASFKLVGPQKKNVETVLSHARKASSSRLTTMMA